MTYPPLTTPFFIICPSLNSHNSPRLRYNPITMYPTLTMYPSLTTPFFIIYPSLIIYPSQQSQFPSCERNGVDQGVHNVLVHKQLIRSLTIWSQYDSPVMNLQATHPLNTITPT